MNASNGFFQSAQAYLDAHPERPRRLCFTNGCFDLLHPGHVKYLEDARALGDFLVVGLNSDASVARLKGDARPLQNEAARAAVLLGLRSVDAVVRLLPGAMSDHESARTDSFYDRHLSAPSYTRPAEYRGHAVPEVLLSGDHKKIAEWRHAEGERLSKARAAGDRESP